MPGYSTNARRSPMCSLLAAAVVLGACAGDDGSTPLDGSSTNAGSGDPSTAETTASTGSVTAGSTGVDVDSGEGTTAAPMDGWQPSLEVGEEVGAFFSIWGPQPDLLYAVASQPLGGGLSEGTIMRWDGTQWTPDVAPEGVAGLNWVYGVESRRFAVGELGTVLWRDGDEGGWTSGSCGTVLPFWGVWAAAPDDAWAVGGDGFNREPFACHFDGVDWTLTEFTPSFESHALYKVWGTASDDVWAVGQDGLLMHWQGEGSGWTEEPSGTDFDLISLWGTGPDEILAVGGRTSGMLVHWDGVAWTAQEAPALPGLNGIWMAADGGAVVGGPQGGVGVVAPSSLVAERQDSGTPLALHAVFGFDGGDQWAVGGSLDMAPPYVGIILRRTP